MIIKYYMNPDDIDDAENVSSLCGFSDQEEVLDMIVDIRADAMNSPNDPDAVAKARLLDLVGPAVSRALAEQSIDQEGSLETPTAF